MEAVDIEAMVVEATSLQWWTFVWVPIAVAVIGLVGGFMGGVFARGRVVRQERADALKAKEVEAAASEEREKRERTAREIERQAFIDQVQEERDAAHKLLQQEREEYSRQLFAERHMMAEDRAIYTDKLDKAFTELDRLMVDKAATREYIAQLKDHIYARLAPPPPTPPPGYIH